MRAGRYLLFRSLLPLSFVMVIGRDNLDSLVGGCHVLAIPHQIEVWPRRGHSVAEHMMLLSDVFQPLYPAFLTILQCLFVDGQDSALAHIRDEQALTLVELFHALGR